MRNVFATIFEEYRLYEYSNESAFDLFVILPRFIFLKRSTGRWLLQTIVVLGLAGIACAQTTNASTDAAHPSAAAPSASASTSKPVSSAPSTIAPALVSPPVVLSTTPGKSTVIAPLSARDLARQQILKEEHQRILGIIPNFSTSYVANAAPLTPGQKFQLAFRGAVDPFQFVAAGLLAGYGQATDNFDEYGQGAQGYAKRFGAAYTDSFDGAILGGAIFPILLREDPRYYRKGTGPFIKRAFYAISTAVITKNDNGSWGPNYANVLGNLAAGGLSNLYYPPEDRGVDLTFQGAAIVTAEGDLGTLFIEFWPDISHKLFKR